MFPSIPELVFLSVHMLTGFRIS